MKNTITRLTVEFKHVKPLAVNMRMPMQAMLLVSLMLLAPLSGCFGENEEESFDASSLTVVEASSLEAGMWQTITLDASNDLAVFIPYFIQDPGSMRAQNGTVLNMESGEQVSLNILLPPRNDVIVFLRFKLNSIHVRIILLWSKVVE